MDADAKKDEAVETNLSDEFTLDSHEKRMSQFTVDDIENMSDDEVLR